MDKRKMGPRPDVSPKEQVKLLGRIIKYTFSRYKFSCICVVVCILVQAVTTLVGMLFIQSLIDDYIKPMISAKSTDFTPLAFAMLRLAIVYVVGLAASYAYNRIMVNVGQGTLRNFRNDLFTNMEKLPIKYFDTHQHGDIMSVYTNDIDTFRQFICQSIPQVINCGTTVIISLVSMLIMSIPMTILAVGMAAVMLVVTKKIAAKSGKYFGKQQHDLGEVDGFIEEMLDGQKVVKVFCHEQEAIDDFVKINDNLRNSAYKANKYANILMPINANIGNISYVLCALLGAVLATNGFGGLTLGTIVSFCTLNKNFTNPISQLSQQMTFVIMASAGAMRLFDLMDQKPEHDDGYVELVNAEIDENGNITEVDHRTGKWAWKHTHKADGTVSYKRQEGGIVFDGVDFGYTDEKMVLHDIKLYAKPGQKIAFVGSTGAGKTTITNLINRFYDIQDGKIRYDEININKIKKPELRKSLGIVLQETNLFTGTVMDNIRYGKLDATDEECIAAAKLANADSFIRRLPDGYQTMLTGDGANLSQGQRQLLSIARAAVADPPVLILDEATSSIDTRTEKLVQAGMPQSMSRVAHCIDNGPMEDFWGILKRERYYGRRFTSKRELIQTIENYIHYYNTRRVQRNLGVLTPMEKHTLCLAA